MDDLTPWYTDEEWAAVERNYEANRLWQVTDGRLGLRNVEDNPDD